MVVLNSDYLSEAFAVPAPVRYVDLKVAEGAEDDVVAALDRTMTEPFVVETVADAEQQLGRAQAGFAGIAFLFGLVALVVGAFLVANTLAMTLAERTREIGLLRAAGLDLAPGDGPLPAPGAGARPCSAAWSACCWGWRWRPS